MRNGTILDKRAKSLSLGLLSDSDSIKMPESATARAKRLAKIRKKAKGSKEDIEEEAEVAENEEPPAKRLKFRNYAPHDISLASNDKNDATTKEISGLSNYDEDREVLDPIKKQLQKVEELEVAEQDSAPKKPHYDLKARIEPKLLKLKKRTTRAIVSILREKLAAEVL
jgi:coiled-coil domain-containing protein 12